MKSSWKSTIPMVLKIIIILLLPVGLLSYVDSHPTVVMKATEESVRSIAIVNEDNGYELNDEMITLSSEVPPLLNEKSDYTWTVVSRSSAEQGLHNQKYDAIMYIPSGFSENIMSFNQESPQSASINFVLQPNLEAKDRQRVQKEMALANNNINKDMTTIYWSYVSQEIEIIREEFDKILEREIEFQNAMYSFYAPSSRTLAAEIEQHQNGLESILNQTSNLSEQSQESFDVANEAKQKITEFAQALEEYKNHHLEQQKLFEQYHIESKAAITKGVSDYESAITKRIEEIDKQLAEYQSPVFLNDSPEQKDFVNVTNGLHGIKRSLNQGKVAFDHWVSEPNNLNRVNSNDKWIHLLEMNQTMLTLYNQNRIDEGMINIKSSATAIINSPSNDRSIEEPEYEQIEPEAINTDILKKNATKLRELYNQVKSSDATVSIKSNGTADSTSAAIDENQDSTIDNEEQTETTTENNSETKAIQMAPSKWDEMEQALSSLDSSISSLDQSLIHSKENYEKVIDYANDWKLVAEQLKSLETELTNTIVNTIINKQQVILENPVMYQDNSLRNQLREVFFDNLQELSNKDVALLIAYGDDLSEFHNTLVQKSNLTAELMEIYAQEEMQEQRKKLLEQDQKIITELSDMFHYLADEEDSTGRVSLVELSFHNLVRYTEDFLTNYEASIQDEFEKTKSSLIDLTTEANSIADQIQLIDDESYQWEESPSLGVLDEQIIVTIQDSSLSDLEMLSESLESLNDSQDNITASTNELQSIVGEVQERSNALNDSWTTNVASTELVRDDVNSLLANTFVDGQENPFVYNHLSNPVNVEGKSGGQVLSETDNRLPPVIMLFIILISGLLIGFISHFYSKAHYYVQSGLFILLNLAVGLIISIYGLNIYNLDHAVSIQWSLFTILLLFATSNIIRGGLFINPFVGWLASIVLIVFFITPMINIVVPDFKFNNPIANAYMGLQYGVDQPYIITMIILGVIILLVSAGIYSLQMMKKKPKVAQDEKAAA